MEEASESAGSAGGKIMRTQWCREHIDETAKQCGLSEETVREVKKVAEFVTERPEFADMPTRPLTILLRTKDKRVQKKTIERLSGILKTGQRPSEEEIRDLLNVVRQDLGKAGTEESTPKTPRKRDIPSEAPSSREKPPEVKENQLTDVIAQMRANPPGPRQDGPPPVPTEKSSPEPTPPAKFSLRTRFPLPHTREEVLLRGQLDDIGQRTKGWMANPDLQPLIPAIQELRRKAREIYGELVSG
jgi:hypothetical protein